MEESGGVPQLEAARTGVAPRAGRRADLGRRVFDWRYSWIAVAALRPAPIARITVAAPVTMSPPAYTPSRLVAHVSGSATMQPWASISSPWGVWGVGGVGGGAGAGTAGGSPL